MPPPSAVPSGVVALAQDLPWGSSSFRAPRKLPPCGETRALPRQDRMQEAAWVRCPQETEAKPMGSGAPFFIVFVCLPEHQQ